MGHNALVLALQSLVPNAQFTLDGETLEGLQWNDQRPQPSESEILAKATELENYQLPNWASFVDALDGDARDIVLGQTRGNLIVDRLIRLENGRTQWEDAEDKLIVDWNFEPPSLTEEQRTDLQSIADTYNIPLVIGADNLLSAR